MCCLFEIVYVCMYVQSLKMKFQGKTCIQTHLVGARNQLNEMSPSDKLSLSRLKA